MQLEQCSNCGATIGKLETAYIHNGAVVCGICDKKLKSSVIAEHQKDKQPPKIISDEAEKPKKQALEKTKMKKCPHCAEEIKDKAIYCKHCGRSTKKWHQKTSVTLTIAFFIVAIPVFWGLGRVHIITGSTVSNYYLPDIRINVEPKNSFGYSETFINVDKIVGLPRVVAMTKYPLGCKILEEKRYIGFESDRSTKGTPLKEKGNIGFESDRSTKKTPIVTYDKYIQIKIGMSYRQVVGIIGAEGKEVGKNQIEGSPGVMESVETIMYEWSNSDGSGMNVMFQNDKLVQINQLGLETEK